MPTAYFSPILMPVPPGVKVFPISPSVHNKVAMMGDEKSFRPIG